MFPANPLKKALCVGISYKGQTGPGGTAAKDFELSGAHNDVWKVYELLNRELFLKFPSADVRLRRRRVLWLREE